MIDQFLVFKPSGIVEFNYQPGKNFSHVTNSFIEDILVSERKIKPVAGSEVKDDEADEEDDDFKEEQLDDGEYQTLGSYASDTHNLKYLFYRNQSNEKLVFVIIFSSLLNFRKPYDFLRDIKNLYLNSTSEKFEQFFNLRLKNLESSLKTTSDSVTPKEQTPLSRDVTPVVEKPTKKSKKQIQAKSGKKSRKWNADGSYYEDDGDSTPLDFSQNLDDTGSTATTANLEQLVGNKDNFGKTTKSGEFLVSDLSEEMDMILSSKAAPSSKKADSSSATSKPFGFLRNIIGGKTITKEDINKVKNALSHHLVKKNVSPNIANSLISEIEKELIGSKTQNFTTVEETAKQSLKQQLIKLLTPNSSINLLNEIQSKKVKHEPYVISVVGVNGVGKSTNLSKLAYWLLQNNYRVLITACDTFRSGAVEQLRTHVNNLTKLAHTPNQISLFESGYGGSDLVAKIAIGAIKHAKENGFDVVLMDTAGRRHNDSQLMAPLASFARAADPDKIIMVGEALVGSDSVMQALNFNKAFGANRHLDFFIVSKCDTVGDLIGSMVNMVYATGIPILFVGTGQTYTDLRTLSVDWAVNMLMS
ncbi:unnamed protein product [Ambrosiozyma monospora]|uniref:Signal recognition particle receptor subunit alpha homolog n=1 Tax=Ambrosiozyma monospora TaxID=43982 RepID=A0A9W6YUC1_AMBMO|nr:unnamed protein product [Ambrosiozyma monospora]